MSANVSTKELAAGTAETHYTMPVAQAIRHVEDTTGLHEERIVNWIEENTRDEKMLGLLDLELLNQDIVAHGDGLAELVGLHNDRLVALPERFNRLAGDRKRLIEFNTWPDAKLDNVQAERSRVVRETWEWLQALRTELARREAVLAKAENVLEAMLTDLTAQREQAVAKLNKSMTKTRREYVQANPVGGEYHFNELVDSDDAVVAIDQEYARRKADLEWATDHRRRASHGQNTVLMRQEEVLRQVTGVMQ
jgi:hypothetical protein